MRERDIIYVGPDAWDNVEKRPHHLVRRLAKTRRVLWLNPGLVQEVPRFIAEPVKLLRTGKGWFSTERGRTRLLWTPPDAPNVRVLSVLAPLPFGGRHPVAHELNTLAVAAQVRLAMAAWGLRDPIVVASHPKAGLLARRLGLKELVYDSIDDFGAFAGRHRADVIDGYERDLVRHAKGLTATAEALAARLRALGREPVLLPNGVDLAHFRPDVAPAALERSTAARVFGFVGLLADWVDLAFVERLARARPSDLVVLVGPRQAAMNDTVDRLARLPNVRVIGPVPYAAVAGWVQAFDVCLLPFARDRLTAAVNPIKLYEYFALGKPVLASGIPEVARYGDLVALYDGDEGLDGAMSELDLERDMPVVREDRRARRRSVAEQHSWDTLARRFAEVIDGAEAAVSGVPAA
ncbi:MAG: hypothetical protein RL199_191 [Pseudomonadota bacterium]|jgi:glycosyltransferase involved in cell wall biosynthesis